MIPIYPASAAVTAQDVHEVADMCMYSQRILKDYALVGMNILYHDPKADLEKVKAFKYPIIQKKAVAKVVKYWPIAKKFYLGVEKNDLPLIVYISTQYMEKSLAVLERYHDSSLK